MSQGDSFVPLVIMNTQHSCFLYLAKTCSRLYRSLPFLNETKEINNIIQKMKRTSCLRVGWLDWRGPVRSQGQRDASVYRPVSSAGWVSSLPRRCSGSPPPPPLHPQPVIETEPHTPVQCVNTVMHLVKGDTAGMDIVLSMHWSVLGTIRTKCKSLYNVALN